MPLSEVQLSYVPIGFNAERNAHKVHVAAKLGIFAVIRSRGRASRKWRLDHLPLSRDLRAAEAEFRQASVTTTDRKSVV